MTSLKILKATYLWLKATYLWSKLTLKATHLWLKATHLWSKATRLKKVIDNLYKKTYINGGGDNKWQQIYKI